MLNKSVCPLSLFLVLLVISLVALPQTKVIRGTVTDIYSSEPIPFASLQFKKARSGKLTDSAGKFVLSVDLLPHDTLQVTYVGYQDYLLPVDSLLLSKAVNGVIVVSVLMERGKYLSEVVVRKKVDRGLMMWKRIVRRKPFSCTTNLNWT
jgi:CarboxypepD_reg-like domain